MGLRQRDLARRRQLLRPSRGPLGRQGLTLRACARKIFLSPGGPMSAPVESSTPTAVIDRIALLLDAFDGPGRLTLAQIVRHTGLPRSSAHRMLERLVQLRWLRRS